MEKLWLMMAFALVLISILFASGCDDDLICRWSDEHEFCYCKQNAHALTWVPDRVCQDD